MTNIFRILLFFPVVIAFNVGTLNNEVDNLFFNQALVKSNHDRISEVLGVSDNTPIPPSTSSVYVAFSKVLGSFEITLVEVALNKFIAPTATSSFLWTTFNTRAAVSRLTIVITSTASSSTFVAAALTVSINSPTSVLGASISDATGGAGMLATNNVDISIIMFSPLPPFASDVITRIGCYRGGKENKLFDAPKGVLPLQISRKSMPDNFSQHDYDMDHWPSPQEIIMLQKTNIKPEEMIFP